MIILDRFVGISLYFWRSSCLRTEVKVCVFSRLSNVVRGEETGTEDQIGYGRP